MAKGSGRQSSTLLGMAPLFIYLFSAAFPPSFKTPVMSDCSSVCQCGAILCAGNVKHTLISLGFVLAADSACLQRWLSPGAPFESLSACPEQQLWWVSRVAASKAPTVFPSMCVSVIRILTFSGHL